MTSFANGARLVAGVAMGVLMAASGPSAAGEITPAGVNGVQHFFDCFGAMINDGQAHQQYCSPGSGVPSNSSLGSFSGGADACPLAGSLQAPLFKPFDVASLGDDFDFVPAKRAELLLAGPRRCCNTTMITPAFAPYRLASLGSDFDVSPTRPAHAYATATNCCYGSLDAPLFAPYQLASLDNSIGGEWAKFSAARTQVAYDPCAPI